MAFSSRKICGFSTLGVADIPNLLFLAFLVFLAFSFQGTPCDFERFSLLSQGFWGFGKQKKSLLFSQKG